MRLTENQLKHLRRLGHALDPVVLIGNAGVSPAVLAEIDHALGHHELIKVRIRAGDRKDRDAMLAKLVADSGATLVQRVGHVALIYRRAEEPRLLLPASGAAAH
ncbi:MAG TPA: ribosome assembly RNA-binding protein YhbY [Gammaproteobacteria bacterium]|nr:ribosome assembly RNA-binding protein YhbY [Gammaproteobacteria bacterium]